MRKKREKSEKRALEHLNMIHMIQIILEDYYFMTKLTYSIESSHIFVKNIQDEINLSSSRIN